MNNIGIIIGSFNNTSLYSSTLFTCGIVLFCMPLYYRSFTDKKTFSRLAPFGGISMMLGWIMLAMKK